MIYECAPMEGVTGDLFRQAQARCGSWSQATTPG